ncbi:DUF4212 domain-containing protein [Erythrobacter litoralis]|uniref:Sodium symporter small subunit domain-containing protein n=1 Tax=Erythrobacter litoralis (strain HTCC2594) TaxID=314225 RepID=Q2NBB9_ERYLH|nr:DUF4212 domain-containing protein [Erythrobacter litoralis]ABC63022.1 hypothetical protein ELI_04650 [Erythrobacter litoralis HTCC2594]
MAENETGAAGTGGASAYWRANLRLLGGLLVVWFAVSFGAGILFRDFLDRFSIGGYPLGFWFAQQGSIYLFILLIVIYNWRIHRIERRYQLDDDDVDPPGPPG